MAWRLAKSLEVLRSQINEAHPGRSTASDGTIGDAAHRAQDSDHNPNAEGVVCALDITNDPPRLDAHALANDLLANRHPDLKYLISNRRIAGDWSGWQWEGYSGSDPHVNHIHISVGVGDDGHSRQPYDNTNPWHVKGADMFEGRSAEDWAIQAKDAERYKQGVVKSLAWKKIPGQIGGGINENPDNIRPVIDSLEEFKAETLAKPSSAKVLVKGIYEVK